MSYPKFLVGVYASNKHREYPRVRYGDLLIETWHTCKSSMQTEVAATRERMRRHEVAYLIVTDLSTHRTLKLITQEQCYEMSCGNGLPI